MGLPQESVYSLLVLLFLLANRIITGSACTDTQWRKIQICIEHQDTNPPCGKFPSPSCRDQFNTYIRDGKRSYLPNLEPNYANTILSMESSNANENIDSDALRRLLQRYSLPRPFAQRYNRHISDVESIADNVNQDTMDIINREAWSLGLFPVPKKIQIPARSFNNPIYHYVPRADMNKLDQFDDDWNIK